MTTVPSIMYYISGHGFGHAARQRPIIKLLALAGVTIHVRTAAPQSFFDFPHLRYHQQRYDIGMIQPDALRVDASASLRWYADFLERQDSIIRDETEFARRHHVRLIVSDMPPVAFDIAQAANIPSIAITNFTWDWVYEYYIDDFPQYRHVIDAIRQSYWKTALALQMPFAHPFDMFPNAEPISLVINTPNRTPEQIRQEFRIPPGDKILLISMFPV